VLFFSGTGMNSEYREVKMKILKFSVYVLILTAIFLASGCQGPETRDTDAVIEPGPSVIDEIPKTLAILPFENNSVTDPERFAPLSKGLAAMLITDLKNSGTLIKIIEREKIQALLKEVALSQSGSIDKSTAVEVGRILGAQAIAFGSFMVIGDNVRMDLRIIKVETSETVMAESISGMSTDFIDLEQRLAKKIANSLKIVFQLEAEGKGSDIDAALLFSQGLEAMDAGDSQKAKMLFSKCIEQDPAYQVQVDNVKGLTP
jgi:TolB-like protein